MQWQQLLVTTRRQHALDKDKVSKFTLQSQRSPEHASADLIQDVIGNKINSVFYKNN